MPPGSVGRSLLSFNNQGRVIQGIIFYGGRLYADGYLENRRLASDDGQNGL